MRYQQSVAQSAEILRMVLPILPRHAAAYTPVSFAVWYEYFAGINPPLRKHVDELLAEGRAIDDNLINDLYRDHIMDAWSSRTLSVNQQLAGLVGDLEHSAERARAGAEEFDASLGDFQQELRQAPPEAAGRVADSGARMRNAVQELRTELEASVEETRRLRSELERLHDEVLTDPLTGLRNRRALESALDETCRQALAEGQACSVIVVDVDHFKKINDTHGHLFGDQVLKSVATAMRKLSRAQDLVARMGGEEFLIVMPGGDGDASRALAENIRATIERGELRQRGSPERVTHVTVSVGVTSLRPGDTAGTLIARADSAMYHAKRQGRNKVVAVP